MLKQPGNQATRHAWLPDWRLQHTGADMRVNQAAKHRPGVAKSKLGDPTLRLGAPKPRRGRPVDSPHRVDAWLIAPNERLVEGPRLPPDC